MIQSLLSYDLVHLSSTAINFQMFLNNYCYILSNHTLAVQYRALSISILFIFLMNLTNGAQFLNITPLFLSSARLAAVSSPAPVIFFVPLTSNTA